MGFAQAHPNNHVQLHVRLDWREFTVNLCRSNSNDLKSFLKQLGATEVVTDSESAMYGDTMPKIFDVGAILI